MNFSISSLLTTPSICADDSGSVSLATTSCTCSSVRVRRSSANRGNRSVGGTPSGYPADSQDRIEPIIDVLVTVIVSPQQVHSAR
ncbi:Uncharacterised protein [Mycobacteroides abscessus subsp. abscessus]|nr:Uncharacterised protein [Mycobacteroides abscessus subsp. abscessus]